ncbi:MAG: conjugal transfer protein TrbE, partial [Hyphomonas sp.]
AIDTDRGAGLAAGWLHGLLEQAGLTLTPELKAALWEGLTALASAPLRERTLTGLSLMLQDRALRTALQPFTLEGPLGRLLDADHDTLALADTVCFEMEELMQLSGAALPVLTHLFQRLEDRFDGRPTLLILDEAWLFLDHSAFAARIRDWLKTLRKKNVAVVFATQSLADISTSAIAPALIESCPTRIFLPNARAGEPQMREAYERFGLNARQTEIIAQATPKRDYYFQSPKGCRLFELGLGPVALAFAAAGTPEDQAALDRVMAETEGEGFAATWLHEKGLAWAADLLSAWPGAPAPAGQGSANPLRPQSVTTG